MNWPQTALLLVFAYVGVFIQAAFDAPRQLLGAQLNPLPALVVYAALNPGSGAVVWLSLLGGLWSDALSANPLGISVLPLLGVGMGLHHWRDLLSREQPYAQAILGLLATGAVSLLTLLLLLTLGESPALGWRTFLQLAVVTLGGAVCAPLSFWLLTRLQSALFYRTVGPPPFRPDREIERGQS
jgi:cell shape-determining protein MreD